MGCVSSKMMLKSSSYRDEHRRMVNGLPALEDLFVATGGEQFLALVCTANTVTRKLQAGQALPKPNAALLESHAVNNLYEGQGSPEVINTWELMAGLEDDTHQGIEPNNCSGGHDVPIQSENSQRNGVISPQHGSYLTIETVNSTGSHELTTDISEKSGKQQEGSAINPLVHPANVSLGEKSKVELMDNKVGKLTRFGKDLSSQESENMTLGDRAKEFAEKGRNSLSLRRAAITRELTSLSIPTTVDLQALADFPAATVTSLTDWIQSGGQLFSPGATGTPKFGPLMSPKCSGKGILTFEEVGNEDEEFAGLDPEFLEALEEALEELSKEEECVMREI
ncbi:hypothetical protein AMTRI_Chr10g233400 [Amborella trichopoda]|uniref:Uncharacterized protein n=1 Tax=Amborella trichopoda TaxID=13333 RepID=U5DF64_AMBTC|nr:uncharacterized protein LOC18447411 [Amborella trichopoda]ERN19038.1 hypothetical protein AMTR_s00061p00071760 [Amborella trichopoda]|eukprot:XP_006857571.1 uncharacterized protein LOC18447411 [Amborella trichopoda]